MKEVHSSSVNCAPDALTSPSPPRPPPRPPPPPRSSLPKVCDPAPAGPRFDEEALVARPFKTQLCSSRRICLTMGGLKLRRSFRSPSVTETPHSPTKKRCKSSWSMRPTLRSWWGQGLSSIASKISAASARSLARFMRCATSARVSHILVRIRKAASSPSLRSRSNRALSTPSLRSSAARPGRSLTSPLSKHSSKRRSEDTRRKSSNSLLARANSLLARALEPASPAPAGSPPLGSPLRLSGGAASFWEATSCSWAGSSTVGDPGMGSRRRAPRSVLLVALRGRRAALVDRAGDMEPFGSTPRLSKSRSTPPSRSRSRPTGLAVPSLSLRKVKAGDGGQGEDEEVTTTVQSSGSIGSASTGGGGGGSSIKLSRRHWASSSAARRRSSRSKK
mmetsp:Transcript_2679/g.5976  ORF Transcript_2679/g.5976 Transcript_2679/m.5976 type:complete len:391 (+) Transcript_2679:209-1381(+)